MRKDFRPDDLANLQAVLDKRTISSRRYADSLLWQFSKKSNKLVSAYREDAAATWPQGSGKNMQM
jgi:hypothetical protein